MTEGEVVSSRSIKSVSVIVGLIFIVSGMSACSKGPTLTASLETEAIVAGAKATVQGALSTPQAGIPIKVEIKSAKGEFVKVGDSKVTNKDGVYKIAFAPSGQGSFEVRTIAKLSTGGTVESPSIVLKVQPRRVFYKTAGDKYLACASINKTFFTSNSPDSYGKKYRDYSRRASGTVQRSAECFQNYSWPESIKSDIQILINNDLKNGDSYARLGKTTVVSKQREIEQDFPSDFSDVAGAANRVRLVLGLQPATPTTPTPSTKPKQPTPTTQATRKLGTRGPAGGIIFYDAGSQKSWGRYLEAAPAGWSGKSTDPLDQRAGTCDDTIAAGRLTSSTSIGAGERLTRALVRHCENTIYNTVAALSIGGKSDWFVPSKGELNELYKRRDLLTGLSRTGNSSSGGATYETSTYTKLVVSELDGYSGGVWCQDFGDGHQHQFCEEDLSYRPIRSF